MSTSSLNEKALDAIYENFRYMISEVSAQVDQTLSLFREPSRRRVQSLKDRDSYIDNLKSLIEDKTYEILIGPERVSKSQVNSLRAINTISSNLERIADFCVNILRQTQHLSDFGFIGRFDFPSLFRDVKKGIGYVDPAMKRRDLGLAIRICQCEFNLDEKYAVQFDGVMKQLKSGGPAGDLVTILFIFHYLERMGDSLLNIGEAVIFSLVGEKMKIHQYEALRESLAASGMKPSIQTLELNSIWGTRSGCRIATATEPGGRDRTDGRKQAGEEDAEEEEGRTVLFKQGDRAKLAAELESFKRWESLAPGLTPKVWRFDPVGETEASILLEFLPGCTLQEMVLSGNQEVLTDALYMVEDTVSSIWETTRENTQASAGFVIQIRKRLEAIYRVHPRFERAEATLGGVPLPGMQSQLDLLQEMERDLFAPFSVLIHGDFNLNNIIYNPIKERIHFIDLHRSRQTDYAQDISVFMVSNFRLPVFEPVLRKRLDRVSLQFLRFGLEFSAKNEDPTFQARLALALARSLFTSTRFEFNVRFAKDMYLRSQYLMERLINHRGKPWEDFKVPSQAVVYL